MKRIVVIDDLDRESEADVTKNLSYDGNLVELDLTQAHHEELVRLLKPYFDAGVIKVGHVGSFASRRAYRKEQREWGALNGIAAHKADSGSWVYPRELDRRFEEYLAKASRTQVKA